MSKIFLVYKELHNNTEHLILFDRISKNNKKFKMKPLCGTLGYWIPKNDNPSWNKICPLCLENYKNISINPHKDRFVIQFQYENICKFTIINYENSKLIEINEKKDDKSSQIFKLNNFINKSDTGKQKNKKSKKSQRINKKRKINRFSEINQLEKKDKMNINISRTIPVIQNLDTPSKSYLKNSEDFDEQRIKKFEEFKNKRDLELTKGYTNFFRSPEFNIYSKFFPELEKNSNKDINGVCCLCLEYNCKKGCYLKKDEYYNYDCSHKRKLINFKY